MDIKKRFKERRALQEQLAKRFGWDCYIAHNATGSVCPATVELAAQYIVDGSHRLATPSEVAGYQEQQKREAERIAALGRRISRTNHRPGDPAPDPNGRRYEFV